MADMARLNVSIDEELDKKLSKYIPYGFKSTIVRVMLEILIDEIEKNGSAVLGNILDKKYKITGSGNTLKVEEK